MLTCKETSELISARYDRKLSLGERMGLRLHLMMCRYCSAVARQIDMIQKLVELKPDSQFPAPSSDQLTADARERIVDAVRDANPNSE